MCTRLDSCARPVVRDLSGVPDPSGACWFHVTAGPARHLQNIAPLGSAPDWRLVPGPIPAPESDRGLIFGRTWAQIDATQRGAVINPNTEDNPS